MINIDRDAFGMALAQARLLGWEFDKQSSFDDLRKVITAYLTTLDHRSPEGKLRVRGCLALGSGNQWVLAGAEGWSDDHMRAQAMDPFDADDDPVEIKWIEVFVDKYAPPAEETVQGREVDHD